MRALRPPRLLIKPRIQPHIASEQLRTLSIATNAVIRAPTISSPPLPRYMPLPTSYTSHPRRPLSSTSSPSLDRTFLYDLHMRHGAKMVPFGGYSMPLQYADLSHSDSHHWTRQKASLFDVSHMVQHYLHGPGAEEFLLKITPSSVDKLAQYHSMLSCLLEPTSGGIVDDTVITRLGPETFYFVTNAGCRAADMEYLRIHLGLHHNKGGKAIQHAVLQPALLALQGPLAANALTKILSPMNKDLNDLSTLHFGQARLLELSHITPRVLVSRGGYTGEDGFEIAIPQPGVFPDAYWRDYPVAVQLNRVAEHLLSDPDVKLAGLAARDSLRLEAGMCLYGHDISLATTPVAAGLSWIIGKDRREGPSSYFYGHEKILPQLIPAKKGGSPPPVRRVGMIIEKGPPAREGADVLDNESGEVVGKVTSGLPSPSLGGVNIAMALVRDGWHKSGTELAAVVRGRRRAGKVVRMPFVDTRYYKG